VYILNVQQPKKKNSLSAVSVSSWPKKTHSVIH